MSLFLELLVLWIILKHWNLERDFLKAPSGGFAGIPCVSLVSSVWFSLSRRRPFFSPWRWEQQCEQSLHFLKDNWHDICFSVLYFLQRRQCLTTEKGCWMSALLERLTATSVGVTAVSVSFPLWLSWPQQHGWFFTFASARQFSKIYKWLKLMSISILESTKHKIWGAACPTADHLSLWSPSSLCCRCIAKYFGSFLLCQHQQLF